MKISKSVAVRLAITGLINLVYFALIEWKTFCELEKAGIDKKHVAYDLAIGFTVVASLLFIIGLISFGIWYV